MIDTVYLAQLIDLRNYANRVDNNKLWCECDILIQDHCNYKEIDIKAITALLQSINQTIRRA